MRILVKRLLKKYKYPPEGQEDALKTVISQCELWTDNVADYDENPSDDRFGKADKTVQYEIPNDFGLLNVAEKSPPAS